MNIRQDNGTTYVHYPNVKDIDNWDIQWKYGEGSVYIAQVSEPLFTIKRCEWLPGENLGIFSNVSWQPNDVVGYYHGVEIDENLIQTDEDSKYIFYRSSPNGAYIDARPILDQCPFAYINSPLNHPDNTASNLRFTGSAYIRASEAIDVGQELLIDYGPDYVFT